MVKAFHRYSRSPGSLWMCLKSADPPGHRRVEDLFRCCEASILGGECEGGDAGEPGSHSHTQPYQRAPSHTQPYQRAPSHTQPYQRAPSHTSAPKTTTRRWLSDCQTVPQIDHFLVPFLEEIMFPSDPRKALKMVSKIDLQNTIKNIGKIEAKWGPDSGCDPPPG